MPFHETPASIAYQDDIQRRRIIAGERAATPEPTPEQIRAYLERESVTVQQEATKQRNEEIGTAWVASHPEYKRSPYSSLMMDEFLNVAIRNRDETRKPPQARVVGNHERHKSV